MHGLRLHSSTRAPASTAAAIIAAVGWLVAPGDGHAQITVGPYSWADDAPFADDARELTPVVDPPLSGTGFVGGATSMADALAGHSPDRGLTNLGRPCTPGSIAPEEIVEITFDHPHPKEGPGADLVIFDARFSIDDYDLAVAAVGGGFTPYRILPAGAQVPTGAAGPLDSELWAVEVDLADFGLGPGDEADRIRIRGDCSIVPWAEPDPVMAAAIVHGEVTRPADAGAIRPTDGGRPRECDGDHACDEFRPICFEGSCVECAQTSDCPSGRCSLGTVSCVLGQCRYDGCADPPARVPDAATASDGAPPVTSTVSTGCACRAVPDGAPDPALHWLALLLAGPWAWRRRHRRDRRRRLGPFILAGILVASIAGGCSATADGEPAKNEWTLPDPAQKVDGVGAEPPTFGTVGAEHTQRIEPWTENDVYELAWDLGPADGHREPRAATVSIAGWPELSELLEDDLAWPEHTRLAWGWGPSVDEARDAARPMFFDAPSRPLLDRRYLGSWDGGVVTVWMGLRNSQPVDLSISVDPVPGPERYVIYELWVGCDDDEDGRLDEAWIESSAGWNESPPTDPRAYPDRGMTMEAVRDAPLLAFADAFGPPSAVLQTVAAAIPPGSVMAVLDPCWSMAAEAPEARLPDGSNPVLCTVVVDEIADSSPENVSR